MIIHQHSSFPGQLTQAGFHTIFHKVLSVVRRDLMWGFFRCRRKQFYMGYNTHKQWDGAFEDKARVTVRA